MFPLRGLSNPRCAENARKNLKKQHPAQLSELTSLRVGLKKKRKQNKTKQKHKGLAGKSHLIRSL